MNPASPPVHRAAVTGSAVRWLVLRVTGVVLAVLVVGHYAMTHLITDVADTDAAFVARRLSSALWVAWDVVMLLAAVVHGAVGTWIVVGEHAPLRRVAAAVVLALLAAAMAAGGILTLVAAERV